MSSLAAKDKVVLLKFLTQRGAALKVNRMPTGGARGFGVGERVINEQALCRLSLKFAAGDGKGFRIRLRRMNQMRGDSAMKEPE